MRHGELSHGAPIHRRTVFERLLFAQCWEDPRLDIQALRPRPGASFVSITSGGCNTLELALHDPARIWAVDMNAAQNHLLALKIAGIQCLEHDQYIELLGVRESDRRTWLYRRCRPRLSGRARDYWDAHGDAIESGVLRSGRYERYLALVRRLLLLIQGERRLRGLLENRSLEARRQFYENEFDRRVWRGLFRIVFSRTVLGRLGLDPAFFTYVRDIEDFGEHFLRRVTHAVVDLPTHDNYFLAQICLGRYRDDEAAIPAYLRAENFERLRRVVDRIVVVTEELGAFLGSLGSDVIDGFNLSNVFEWVSQEAFERNLMEIHRVARPGARVCYRNLLVPRSTPASFRDRFQPDPELGRRLLEEDRSFVYSHFEIATAIKETTEPVKPSYEETGHERNHPAVALPDPSLDTCWTGVRNDRGAAAVRR